VNILQGLLNSAIIAVLQTAGILLLCSMAGYRLARIPVQVGDADLLRDAGYPDAPDGLGYLGAYWRVVVPNSGAFFAAIAVITFIASWNAFLWPLVIGQDSSMWTVQVALSTFLTAQTINLHELFLAAAVSILPLVLVFVFLQRYLVQGVAETGIKR
jgi:ABC-type glycerol-3-phosphate transport system permease component